MSTEHNQYKTRNKLRCFTLEIRQRKTGKTSMSPIRSQHKEKGIRYIFVPENILKYGHHFVKIANEIIVNGIDTLNIRGFKAIFYGL